MLAEPTEAEATKRCVDGHAQSVIDALEAVVRAAVLYPTSTAYVLKVMAEAPKIKADPATQGRKAVAKIVATYRDALTQHFYVAM